MTNQPAPAMHLHPTAEVSEDADAVLEQDTGDPWAKLNESAYTRNLRLVAENTNLRLRVMALEEQLARKAAA